MIARKCLATIFWPGTSRSSIEQKAYRSYVYLAVCQLFLIFPPGNCANCVAYFCFLFFCEMLSKNVFFDFLDFFFEILLSPYISQYQMEDDGASVLVGSFHYIFTFAVHEICCKFPYDCFNVPPPLGKVHLPGKLSGGLREVFRGPVQSKLSGEKFSGVRCHGCYFSPFLPISSLFSVFRICTFGAGGGGVEWKGGGGFSWPVPSETGGWAVGGGNNGEIGPIIPILSRLKVWSRGSPSLRSSSTAAGATATGIAFRCHHARCTTPLLPRDGYCVGALRLLWSLATRYFLQCSSDILVDLISRVIYLRSPGILSFPVLFYLTARLVYYTAHLCSPRFQTESWPTFWICGWRQPNSSKEENQMIIFDVIHSKIHVGCHENTASIFYSFFFNGAAIWP